MELCKLKLFQVEASEISKTDIFFNVIQAGVSEEQDITVGYKLVQLR